MHLKEVPTDVVDFASHNKWILLGGAAVLVAGYLYVNHAHAGTPSAGGSSVTYGDPSATGLPSTVMDGGFGSLGGGSSFSALGAGGSQQVTTDTAPTTTNVGSISTSSGFSDPGSFTIPDSGSTIGGVNGGSSDPMQSILGLQYLQTTNDFTYAMAQLAATTNVALANANLAALSLASANFSTSAFLASTFINSPNQASVVHVSGNGAPGSDLFFSGVNFQNSNKNGWDANLATYINNGTFQNAVNTVFPQYTAPQTSTPVSSAPPQSSISSSGMISSVPQLQISGNDAGLRQVPTAGYDYSKPPPPAPPVYTAPVASAPAYYGGGGGGSRMQMQEV